MQLSVSSFFLWKECQSSSPPRMTKEWRSVRLYLVPSVIYLIHNNVQFATLTYVDPSTYQILGNLKIVTIGILFRCVILSLHSNVHSNTLLLNQPIVEFASCYWNEDLSCIPNFQRKRVIKNF
jgi:solute carrier family 35 (UDP-sugar transporter), member A1/2/3